MIIVFFIIIAIIGILFDRKMLKNIKKSQRIIYYSIVVLALAVFCLAEFSDLSLSRSVLFL